MQMSIYRAAFKSALVAAAMAASVGASAAEITSIFGGGVTNQGWTANPGSADDVVLALRARLRYPAPSNTVNWDGTDTYTYNTGAHSQYGFNNLAEWNIDFSMNAGDGNVISDYTYVLGLDTNSGLGVSHTLLDPFATWTDNSFGDPTTTMGNGVDATGAANQAALMDEWQIAQNSQNMGWIFPTFDPTVNGTYSLYLAAYAGTQEVARTSITVIVGDGGTVPEPGSLALVGLALAGAAVASRRKQA